MRPSGCCSGSLPASGSRACSPAVDGSAPTPPTCWRRCGSPDRLELVTETLRAALEALAVTVGIDGFALLQAVYAHGAPTWLLEVPAVQTLRRLWLQQYYRDQHGVRWRGKSDANTVGR